MRTVCFVVSILGPLVGCAALSSETAEELDARDRGPRGVAYSLPTGITPLVLSVHPNSAVFKLEVRDAEYVPDSKTHILPAISSTAEL